jgi:hypothetical protein
VLLFAHNSSIQSSYIIVIAFSTRILTLSLSLSLSLSLYIYRIVRFVIENTIEERILKLQEKKELVFEGQVSFVWQSGCIIQAVSPCCCNSDLTDIVFCRTIGGCSEALGKLSEEDLRFLFVT